MGVVAIDVDFLKHGKAHAVVRAAELTDFFSVTGFLSAELIAWKTEYAQPPVTVFLVQRFEPFVLGGKSALACGIYHQQHSALEYRERSLSSLQRVRAEIIDACQLSLPVCRWHAAAGNFAMVRKGPRSSRANKPERSQFSRIRDSVGEKGALFRARTI